MAKAADISTKRLISLAPENWVKWVTKIPDIVSGEILNSEFQWISRESDVLVRASSPQYGEFILLNELQLRYKSEMPKRMRAYAALAEEKYNLPTYPVLINILKASDVEIPTSYESEFAGLQARQDYHVINLWEVDVEIAFTQPVLSLLPFVPILKGGAEESTVQRALQILRADEQLSQLETVMAFFATFSIRHSSYSCTQSRTGNGINFLPSVLVMLANCQQHRPHRNIRNICPSNNHGNSHGRSMSQKRMFVMTCFHNH